MSDFDKYECLELPALVVIVEAHISDQVFGVVEPFAECEHLELNAVAGELAVGFLTHGAGELFDCAGIRS